MNAELGCKRFVRNIFPEETKIRAVFDLTLTGSDCLDIIVLFSVFNIREFKFSIKYYDTSTILHNY